MKLRRLRAAIGIIAKLRAHAARLVEAVSSANRILDKHFGTLLQLRDSLLDTDVDDADAEIGRRASLNRLAFVSQQMLLEVQLRFSNNNEEA